jgi:hypothetical protein
MKPHRIIKKFKGTQTGHGDGEVFEPGPEPVLLSDSLAETAVKAGFAKPHVDHAASPAESRETKVVAPDEVKDDVQPTKKKKS